MHLLVGYACTLLHIFRLLRWLKNGLSSWVSNYCQDLERLHLTCQAKFDRVGAELEHHRVTTLLTEVQKVNQAFIVASVEAEQAQQFLTVHFDVFDKLYMRAKILN